MKAFQVFEEREQLAREINLERTASVKNTMKLHSNNAKNVLAKSASIRRDPSERR